MNSRWTLCLGLAGLLACGEGVAPVSSEELLSANEGEVGTTETGLAGKVAVGTKLKTTAELNLRAAPGSSCIFLVMPKGSEVVTLAAAPENGFYSVEYGGRPGFASGQYLTLATPPTPDPPKTVNIVGPDVLPHVQRFANAACAEVGCPFTVGTRNGHHPTASRAIDLMMAKIGTRPTDGGARGDKLAKYAIDNFDKYKVMYVMWKQRLNTNDGRGWRRMEDRGSITDNHYDHVHVSFRP